MEAIDPRWRKSSYSGNGGNCLEAGQGRRRVLVRDTHDRSGPVLRISPDVWCTFVEKVKRSLAPAAS